MIDGYIEKAVRTLAPGQGTMLHVVLGLNGEWHELNLPDADHLKESGDFFWYLALGFHILSREDLFYEILNQEDATHLNDLIAGLDECTDLVKRVMIYGQEIEIEQFIEPLLKIMRGFLIWLDEYSALCLDDIPTILDANIAKLQKRYPHKFTIKDSIRKADSDE